MTTLETRARAPFVEAKEFDYSEVTFMGAPIDLGKIAMAEVSRIFDLAQEIINEAISYRDFNVTAVAVAVCEDLKKALLVRAGNFLPEKGSPDKSCAEKTIHDYVVNLPDYYHIPLMGLYGPHQNDDESGRPSKSLHPCGSCRRMGKRSAHIDDSTIIATMRLGESVIAEAFTFGELTSFHRGEIDHLGAVVAPIAGRLLVSKVNGQIIDTPAKIEGPGLVLPNDFRRR